MFYMKQTLLSSYNIDMFLKADGYKTTGQTAKSELWRGILPRRNGLTESVYNKGQVPETENLHKNRLIIFSPYAKNISACVILVMSESDFYLRFYFTLRARWLTSVKTQLWIIIVVIVTFGLLKRHSKSKRRAPAYSRALRQIRGLSVGLAQSWFSSVCQNSRNTPTETKITMKIKQQFNHNMHPTHRMVKN